MAKAIILAMRVALFGATGFIGGAILDALKRIGRDLEISALIRTTAEPRGLGERIDTYPGNILNPRDVEEVIRGCQAVINAVGIIAERGKNTFANIHVKALELTVDTAKKTGCNHYILISALGTRANAASTYHQTKFAGEQALRESGISYTIFQPSVVFGEKDRFINLLAKLVYRLPIVPIIGNGENKLQPIFVKELAMMVSKSLTTPELINGTIPVGGGKIYSYNEVLKLLAKLLDRHMVRFLHIPMWIMKYPAMTLKTPINYDQWLMLQEDNVLSEESYKKQVELFGFEPSKLEDVLPSYIHQVVKGGGYRDGST